MAGTILTGGTEAVIGTKAAAGGGGVEVGTPVKSCDVKGKSSSSPIGAVEDWVFHAAVVGG
jgi:hypothetical protein